jgi:predicted nucleotidyltransferase
MPGHLQVNPLLNQDHLDILSAFSDQGVKYLVIGAHALAAHGVLRATGDLDLHVQAGPDNADRVLKALTAFGAPLAELSRVDLATSGTVYQVGVTPNRIDILTAIDGVTFEEAWDNRMEIEVEGITVPVIGLEDLIRNKRAVGRLQDLADVEKLENLQK